MWGQQQQTTASVTRMQGFQKKERWREAEERERKERKIPERVMMRIESD